MLIETMGTATNTLATPLTRAPGQALTPPTPRLTHRRTARAAQNGGVAQRSEFSVHELLKGCSKPCYSFSLCHVVQHFQLLFGILLFSGLSEYALTDYVCAMLPNTSNSFLVC